MNVLFQRKRLSRNVSHHVIGRKYKKNLQEKTKCYIKF
uniref:Uncharacterized protein n=1 Tax=Arundo donax TaxID=35708 RepID=A0A0A9BL11_ARUDO